MGFQDKQTRFNAGLSSLERLHDLLKDCNEYSRLCGISGNDCKMLEMWRVTIIAFYREISPKVKKIEKEAIKKLFSKSKTFGSIMIEQRTPDGIYKVVNPMIYQRYWMLYNKVETLLRKIADVRGMLIPDQTDDMFEPDDF